MAVGDARIQAVGRLGADPELRFTPAGVAVASLNLAVQGRVKNGDRWEDGETTWYRVTVWREYAENVAESYAKGDRVVVIGTVCLRKYETREGGEGQSLEIQAESVTPDLRFATVRINRIERQQGGGGGGQQGSGDWGGGGGGGGGGQRQQSRPQGGGGQYGGGQRGGGAPADDPWGAPPANQWGGGGGQGGGGFTDEPPF
jgi:single-strand DNA-binding protein